MPLGDVPRRELRLTIIGKPVPKGSRVQGYTKTGRSFSREANKHVGPWMKAARAQVLEQFAGEQLVAPYAVSCEFYFDAPKQRSWPRSGDTEKYMRAVADVLQDGGTYGAGVISDDRHIVEFAGVKRYAQEGSAARVEVLVREVDGY